MRSLPPCLLLGLLAMLALTACGNERASATPEPQPSATPSVAPTATPTATPEPEPIELTLFVGRERVECPAKEAPLGCLQIRERPDLPYTPFAGVIEDFEYEAGFEYKLIVRSESVASIATQDPPPAFTLLHVADKVRTYATVGPCRKTYRGETIAIYQLADLSGPLSSIQGQGLVSGAEDALALINDAGGICGAQLDVHVENSRHDLRRLLSAYEKSKRQEPGPAVILTTSSLAGISLKERVKQDGIVNITAGLNAEALYAPPDGRTVAIAPTYPDQFAGFIRWVRDNWATLRPKGAANEIVVGVIGWDNAFGRSATTAESLAFVESLDVQVLPLAVQDLSPTTDITPQVQALLAGGANVIYVQSLSHGPAQVVGTLWGLGAWNKVVVGGVNWTMSPDVTAILGQNAHLMGGYYSVFPYRWWNDTDVPGVQRALAAFEAGNYPDSKQDLAYLLSFGAFHALHDILTHAVNRVGLSNLDGQAFFEAMQDLGTISAAGLYELDLRDGARAPRQGQIRQAQLTDEGLIDFVVVQDFVELPDVRPSP